MAIYKILDNEKYSEIANVMYIVPTDVKCTS